VSADPSGSESAKSVSPPAFQRLKAYVVSPAAAGVGLLAAVAQIFDYLLDDKVRLLWLAIVTLAAVVCVMIGWRTRRRMLHQAASIGRAGAVVYGSAVVSALSLAAVATTSIVATTRSDAPPGLPPVTMPSGLPFTALPTPSADVQPLASGATCGPGTSGPVTITSVHAADGGSELGSDVVVAVSVSTPPAGSSYWLMAYADDIPRNLYFVWAKLEPGDSEVRHTIRSDVGSHRKILVVQSSATSEEWFNENQQQDRNSNWDGQRVDLPSDAHIVSNSCDVIRDR
jgi:hypothetical protein